MTRPLLLDLFCGAGGASVGYHRAGFDIVGVDKEPQPRYPFRFHQADALEALHFASLPSPSVWAGMPDWPMGPFAAIHASPPCQRWSATTPARYRDSHPNLLGPVRDALKLSSLPWVIENVPRAPLRPDYRLCGCMFGLPNLKRERWFETSWGGFDLRQPCNHRDGTISVCGTGGGTRTEKAVFGRWPGLADWRRCMDVDWMDMAEIVQAIPPAYTEYIGAQLLDALERAA